MLQIFCICVMQAYEVLSDPNKRILYDANVAAEARRGTSRTASQPKHDYSQTQHDYSQPQEPWQGSQGFPDGPGTPRSPHQQDHNEKVGSRARCKSHASAQEDRCQWLCRSKLWSTCAS